MTVQGIDIANRYPGLQVDEAAMRLLFASINAMDGLQLPAGDLSVAFLTDLEISRLHQDFMGDSSATDVITFPGDQALGLVGEICVSVDHARHAAAIYQHTFAEELTLYLVHGWLHLVGYNDTSPRLQQAMQRVERSTMATLQQQQRIPPFRLVGSSAAD